MSRPVLLPSAKHPITIEPTGLAPVAVIDGRA